MKNLLIYFLLFISCSAAGQIKVGADGQGQSASSINAFTNINRVAGADYKVATIADRNNITANMPWLVSDGITCYVRATDLLYRWNASTLTWVTQISGIGSITRGFGFQNSGTTITPPSGTLDIDTTGTGVLSHAAADLRQSSNQTKLAAKLNVADTAGFANNLVHKAKAETITGPKTFTAPQLFSGAAPTNTYTSTGNGNSATVGRDASNGFRIQNDAVPAGTGGKSKIFLANSTQYAYGNDSGLPFGNAKFGIAFWHRGPIANEAIQRGLILIGVNQNGTTSDGTATIVGINNAGQPYLLPVGTGSASGTTSTLSAVNIRDGNKHLVIVNYDGAGTANIYVDQTLRSTTTGLNIVTTLKRTFSVCRPGTSTYTNADLDQLQIFNDVISSTNRTLLWNNGSGIYNPNTIPGRLRDYEFEEASGSVAVDLQGSGFDLTLVNNPAINLNGMVPVPSSGSVQRGSVISDEPASGGGDLSVVHIGQPGKQILLDAQYLSTLTNLIRSKQMGKNGLTSNDITAVADSRNILGNTTETAIDDYRATAQAAIGQLQLRPDMVDLTPSTDLIGALKMGADNNIQVVTGTGILSKLAYVGSSAFEKLIFNQGTTTTVANTTTETSAIGSTGTGSLTLPAGYLTLYKNLRISFRGIYGSQTVSSPTLTVRIYIGGVMVATGSATAFFLGATNNTFNGSLDINTMSIGASGSVYAQGLFNYNGTGNANFNSTSLDLGTGTATINTTIANNITMTYQWGTASAANTITTKLLTIEALN